MPVLEEEQGWREAFEVRGPHNHGVRACAETKLAKISTGGDLSRHRRGCHVDIPRRPNSPKFRREETRPGTAAAVTWIFRGSVDVAKRKDADRPTREEDHARTKKAP